MSATKPLPLPTHLAGEQYFYDAPRTVVVVMMMIAVRRRASRNAARQHCLRLDLPERCVDSPAVLASGSDGCFEQLLHCRLPESDAPCPIELAGAGVPHLEMPWYEWGSPAMN